jgi:hypothetical protein
MRITNKGNPVVTFGDADENNIPLEVLLTSKSEAGSK